jgi:hypothetical protein
VAAVTIWAVAVVIALLALTATWVSRHCAKRYSKERDI